MAITKEITHLEKSNVKLSVTVPKDDVRAQYEGMLNEYSKNLQLPGFRKGKVPKEVLERKFAESLRGEAMGRIIESALQEIFKEETLPRNERPLPYAAPELEDEPKLDFENDLQFSVVYDVLPKIEVKKWKGLSVEYTYAEVEKEDIDRELEEIRERNSIVMDRDDSACAQKGDIASIDYQMFGENGAVMTEHQRKDFVFTIGGSSNNVLNFEDDIIGMKKGETKEFDKSFPDTHIDPALAGKTRKVHITLTSLKEKKLPDLDDDLAQDVDEKFKNLDDLKNSLKEKLEKNLDWRLREKKVNEILKKIMENTPVILPESMVKAEIEGRWRRLANYYNISVDTMMQLMSGENNPEKNQDWRNSAEKALHSRIIIETLLEEQKIDVTEEDVEKEFERIAGLSGGSVEDVKKSYNEEAVFYLKEDIKERKITDVLLAENTLKPGKKEKYLAFMTDNG